MELEKAIETLNDCLPDPTNKLVSMARLPVCCAWVVVKEHIKTLQDANNKLIEENNHLNEESGWWSKILASQMANN